MLLKSVTINFRSNSFIAGYPHNFSTPGCGYTGKVSGIWNLEKAIICYHIFIPTYEKNYFTSDPLLVYLSCTDY